MTLISVGTIMPKFFDKNNLTKEQKSRWDWAVLKYRQIREKNTLSAFEELDENERLNIVQDLQEAREFNGSLTSEILDEKSALFARLLDGKKPLLYPPPCAYSYPWYSVVEDNGPWDLSLETSNLEELFWENLSGEQEILIEQTPWKVIRKISNDEVLVTFGKWQDMGFEWRLVRRKKSCKDTVSFICSHHDSKIPRITTYEQLRDEQMYHVIKEYDKIKLVLDNDFKKSYEEDLSLKYGKHFGETFLNSDIKTGEELLKVRREKKLSDYPTIEELVFFTEKRVKEYLSSGYSLDSAGNLYVDVWVLEKVAGKVTDDVYMVI